MKTFEKIIGLAALAMLVIGEPMPWEVDEHPPVLPPLVPATPQPESRPTPIPEVTSDDRSDVYLTTFRKAENGDVEAALALALMYLKGEGVEANAGESVVWFRTAAMGGNATAMNYYGVQLWKGNGIREDKNQAVKWFQKAADHGDASGAFNMGRALSEGEGVEKDTEEALRYFRLAEKRGHRKAAAEIEGLAKKQAVAAVAPTPTPLPADADSFDKSLDKINRKLDKVNNWLDALNEALE